MKTRLLAAMLIGGLASIISACASTTLDMTWRDPTYEGRPFAKVLVVGSTDSPDNRRIFEDVLVSELKGSRCGGGGELYADPGRG